MPDTFSTIHLITTDSDFTGRLNAGAAKEDAPGDPVRWVWDNRYSLAAAPGWAAAVDSWFASHPEADPVNGWALDQSVISDGQITSQIQVLLNVGSPDA